MELRRKSVVWLGSVLLAGSALASDYVVTVGSGVTNVVDDAFVTALGSADRLVKRGAGVLESNAKLSAFEGEIVAEEGVVLVRESGALGTSAGATVVSNGASLVIRAASKDTCKFYSETFKIAGPGAPGEKGAFANVGASLTGPNIRYITLLDDASVYAWGELTLYAGQLDMNGKILTLYVRDKNDSGSTSWEYTFSMARSRLVNPGHIILETGKFTVTGRTLSDGTAVWDGDDSNTLTIRPKTRFCLSQSLTKLPWKLIFGKNDSSYGGFYPSSDISPSSPSNNAWCGTVELQGPAISFSYTSKQTGTVNLLGALTGVGGFTCSGYTTLHLWGEGSFAGLADVSGNTTGRTPLTLHNARALPVNGQGLRVSNANFVLDGTDAFELPKIQFTNDTAYAISNATARGTVAQLEKSGPGILSCEAALSVTGTLHIASGTVRVPVLSTRVQAAGVMEGTTNFTDTTAADSNWNNYYSSRPALTQQLDSVRYPYLTAQSLWAAQAAGIRYRGYLWNHSSTNETWSFMSGVQRRSRLYVNNANVFANNSWKCQVSANHAVFGQAVLKPGANRFDYYMEVSASTTGGAGGSTLDTIVDFDGTICSKTSSNYDLVWGTLKGLAYNPCGTRSHNEADYLKFENLADGELMTVTNDFSHLSPKAKTTVNDLAIDRGAWLDLTEPESTLSVRTLACGGAITNGHLTVTKALVVPAATIAGDALALKRASLAWTADAVVDCDDVTGLSRERLAENPYVLVTAETPFAAAPAVSATLAAHRWSCALSKDAKSILLYRTPAGLAVYLK